MDSMSSWTRFDKMREKTPIGAHLIRKLMTTTVISSTSCTARRIGESGFNSQPTTMETTIEESRARSDQNLSLPLPPPRPLTVTLAGLGTFPSTKSARVFWASPREQMNGTTNLPGHSTQMRLHRFCLLIRQAFRAEGFITETRPLVLHATVANIRQTTQPKGGRTSKGRAWASSKQRWEGVDGRDVVRVFDRCRGDVLKAEEAAARARR